MVENGPEERMLYRDLREWIERADEVGELKRVNGADWNLEVGALAEVAQRLDHSPAVLFDNIRGYPQGRRILTGVHNPTLKRQCLTNHLPLDCDRDRFIQAWKERLNDRRMIPPRLVADGPLLENVFEGSDIDLFALPIPQWHEEDGGRYLGTADITITRDPDDGWVNLGCYRVMAHDRDTLALYMSPGHHGNIHRQKYFDRKKPMPVAISFGPDPLLWLAAMMDLDWGVSELDYAGGLRGEPFDVIEGKYTGLPIPAAAEIVVEGEVLPGTAIKEGPFGEFTGYYASGERAEPMLKVKRLMHRNDPIITGAPPIRPGPGADSTLIRSAFIWDHLEKAGVPDVTGVACYQTRFFIAVSIRQRYPGHARQAAVVASQCRAGALLSRYVVVVDDDIDIWDFNDVLWAICTRADPANDIEIMRRCWSNPLDPIIPPRERGFNSRAVIDACRPYEWAKDFPPVSGASAELKERVLKKFGRRLVHAK
jgi:4-hydroxy-3-polyprenylbenzoate decarboxylase